MKTLMMLLVLALTLAGCSQGTDNSASRRKWSGISTTPYNGSLRDIIPKEVGRYALMNVKPHFRNYSGTPPREAVEAEYLTAKRDSDKDEDLNLTLIVSNYSTAEQLKANMRVWYEITKKTFPDAEVTLSPMMKDERQVGDKIVTVSKDGKRSVGWTDGTLHFSMGKAIDPQKAREFEDAFVY
jgi:hypothetical protein